MRKIVCLSIIVISFVSILFGIYKLCNNDSKKPPIDNNPIVEGPQKPSEPYGFNHLNDWQKDLYIFIENDLKLLDKSAKEIGYMHEFDAKKTYKEVITVLELVDKNTNELTSVYYYEEVSENIDKILYYDQNIIGIKKSKSIKSLEEYNEEYKRNKEKAMEIINKIPENATEFEKVKIIHDEIIKKTKYYYSTDKDFYGTPSNNHIYSSSPYGPLVNGYAICGGYSSAFKYVADLVGLYSLDIGGTISRNDSDIYHAWNMIWIDGNWYHLDLTWDDPPTSYNTPDDEVYYSYFLISDDDIKYEKRTTVNYATNIPVPKSEEKIDSNTLQKLIDYKY